MTKGVAYWVGCALGTAVLTLTLVAVNSFSDGSIFAAGCFVAVLCLSGLGFSINEFRKM